MYYKTGFYFYFIVNSVYQQFIISISVSFSHFISVPEQLINATEQLRKCSGAVSKCSGAVSKSSGTVISLP